MQIELNKLKDLNLEKLEIQRELRDQIDFKVMVRTNKKEKWQDFTGMFLMKEGWDKTKVSKHIKEHFYTDQFRHYTFGIFERHYVNTTNNINNNFKFEYLNSIKLLENDLPLD